MKLFLMDLAVSEHSIYKSFNLFVFIGYTRRRLKMEDKANKECI